MNIRFILIEGKLRIQISMYILALYYIVNVY